MVKIKHVTITRTSTEEIENKLEEFCNFLNETRITGVINKSKIMRIALLDWIEKQEKIRKLLEEDKEVNKTAKEILQENELY